MRFAVGAPVVLGTLLFFVALAAGRLDTAISLGPLSVTPLLMAIALGLGSVVVAGLFCSADGSGFGPLAAPPAPDDPIRLLDPPAPRPTAGCGRVGCSGIPVVWMAACLVILPLVVYVHHVHPVGVDEDHQIVPGLAARAHRADADRPHRARCTATTTG